MLGKFIVIAALVIVVLSLGSGMFYLVRDKSNSTRTLKALTVRIVLSLVLFALLFVLYLMGLIQPHGVYPN